MLAARVGNANGKATETEQVQLLRAKRENVENERSAARVAVVTGASGGVGRGIALACGAAGWRVWIAARRAQEGEAVAKWKRARLTSTQLSTYFIGTTEHLAMRERARARDGAAFDLKKYNDAVLSFGSPPVKYVREMLGL